MIDTHEILWGVVAPPLLMAGGMLAIGPWPALRHAFSLGFLIAMVFAICQLGFRNWAMPGKDVQDWPAWIAVVGGLMACCSVGCNGHLGWRLAIRLAMTGLAAWLLLKPLIHDQGLLMIAAWVFGSAIAWTALLTAYERVHATASETSSKASLITLVTLGGLTAISLLLFNCLTHAQYSGIFTAALTAALVIVWWRPSWYNPQGLVMVAALILPTLWLLSNRYSNLPIWALPLLALAGLAPLVVWYGPIRKWSEWKRLAIMVAIIGMVLSPVVGWGVVTSLRAAAEPSYGY